MDSLCIICLASLPSAEAYIADATLPNQQTDDALLDHLDTTPPAKADVAHLQNCRHTFHDHCLTVWIEVIAPKFGCETDLKVANTCPACRANFNQVDISDTIEGIPLINVP